MSQFYTQLATVADNLITQFGREVQLLKESRTPSDASKPWRGTDDVGDDSVTVRAAIVEFDSNEVDGELIRRGDMDCFVAAVDGKDLATYDFLVDEGGIRWRIINTRKFRPASTTVAYRLQLRK